VSILRTPHRPWHRGIAGLGITLLLAGAAGCDVLDEVAVGPTGPASAGEAAELLDQLTVASAGGMRGYSRARFPHWSRTGDNCDVRDTVLDRDGTGVHLDGCDVVGGEWHSGYDARTLTDPSDVDIDHMVPLANAWRSGADAWDPERRREFANDLDRPQLFAVSASSNRAKGDQDPSQWQPPNRDYWCTYAEDWIVVKHHWELSVTTAEKTTLSDMLETCR